MPTLLARVRSPELAVSHGKGGDRELRESVLENLRRICATRIGTALSSPGVGLPNISDVMHEGDGPALMARALRVSIGLAEPRLSNVVVSVPNIGADTGVLHFSVTADIIVARRRRPVSFVTSVDASRRVRVE